MSVEKPLTFSFPIPVIAIVGVGLISYAFYAKSNGENGVANTVNCTRARAQLREADQRFADALAGLCKVSAAQERVVIGDRRLASKYIQQITAIRERLHQISEDADGLFAGVVLPEINSINED